MISHVTSLRTSYRDTDQMKVVYHGNYVEYFERARTQCLRDHGLPYKSIEDEGLLLVVLEVGLNIRRPARYDEVLEIVSRIHPMEGMRLRIDYEIRRDDVVLVTGHTSHAFVETETFRPRRPPARFLSLVNG